MIAAAHPRRTYDHRVRALVHRTRDPDLLPELDIPRSTARSWIRRPPRRIVSLDLMEKSTLELHHEILDLRRRVRVLATTIRLLLALLHISGFRLDEARLPDGTEKARLLRAIDRARKALPLASVLRELRLSPARYHAWTRREAACDLDDRSSCPRTTPQGLTRDEITTIQDMVTDEQLRHMPLRALALYAQRIGRVFASPSTWGRLVREHGWRRPRRRLYPAKPKIGLRASRPNQYFHIDVTVLKLIDGTRANIHAVIDNFSRKILAWKVADRLEPTSTCEVLTQAAQNANLLGPTTVVADSGVENINGKVDALVATGLIRLLLAQVEIAFSNSMIEAWWRSLRHHWLYLHHLDSLAAVRRLVAFYVQQHNEIMPHAAFHGQTPDEVYFGMLDDVPEQLAAARARAMETRLQTNRNLSCEACRSEHAPG